ncbi:PadR family transcriptional regulator [Lutispora saccharofermentans]|uniref:PadR family transcriptional regulator n=1 Tax=Lutispora saccharofermentans TaxID=3024236 RepID=A0ABT1NF19_9FIRM|nr:PadR family transcriptional regulator [Lutispora saccharofermentans]MCQ1529659.1 PadR family transcriptional regulator [Lutispora saccharofermentans]
MSEVDEIVSSLAMELRRGTLVLSVLSQLEEEQYGYSLVQRLTERGLSIDQSTLYPLLRRLEKQELLDSSWSLDEARPRRYYILNAKGKRVLNSLMTEWVHLNDIITKLLETKNGDGNNEKLD